MCIEWNRAKVKWMTTLKTNVFLDNLVYNDYFFLFLHKHICNRQVIKQKEVKTLQTQNIYHVKICCDT